MALPKLTQPIFEFVIPSNSKKVKIRPMLVKEEKLLLIAKQGQSKADIMNAIKQVLNNCIVTENINVDELAIFDMEYLFLKLRSVSISNMTKVSFQDSEDEKQYDFDVDLDTVTLKMPDKVKKTFNLSKTVILELDWPKAKLYTTTELYDKEDSEMFEFLLKECMVKIYDGDNAFDPKLASAEEMKEFIENIPVKNAEEIKAFIYNVPTLEHKITFKNTKGTEREIILNTLDDFFTL